ncbi:MAG TPA: GtrA family protein [Solirubrobacteraceae bacterium]|nr:GtrA family protein [Solirubrobacteraceae bacterium]
MPRRLTTAPSRPARFVVKLTRYAIGSLVALATSVIAFALLIDAGAGTTVGSVLAFVAGAIPNWILNRRWTWERRGEMDVAREVVGYGLISLVALAASSGGTGWADAHLRGHLPHAHALRVLLVTVAYVLVQGVLFVAKFIAYDALVFNAHRRSASVDRRARRPRARWSAARLRSPELESDAPA